jgi:hypothetical protein
MSEGTEVGAALAVSPGRSVEVGWAMMVVGKNWKPELVVVGITEKICEVELAAVGVGVPEVNAVPFRFSEILLVGED